MSFLFVAVSSYIVGLVGSSNNPASGMTISTLLISGALLLALGLRGDAGIMATLGVAAVVCSAICTAADCSQDLKTGHMLKATPKLQQKAQFIGVLIPAFIISPVLNLLHNAYGIGDQLKAPQASLFASLGQALFGKGSLDTQYIYIGMALGLLLLAIDHYFLKDKEHGVRLYLMPVAIGLYLPFTLALPIALGGFLHYLVSKKKEKRSGHERQRWSAARNSRSRPIVWIWYYCR